jgi:hypothetical protein
MNRSNFIPQRRRGAEEIFDRMNRIYGLRIFTAENA